MNRIELRFTPFPKKQLRAVLEKNLIRINELAERFLADPRFDTEAFSGTARIVVVSLRELGFEDGAALPEIVRRAGLLGLKLCRPSAGLYLRLAWRDQPVSGNTILSGQHRSPDGAVTVLSEPLEEDDAFPKGLYLRNVGGELWLRGYRCDRSHLWSPDDLFALEE